MLKLSLCTYSPLNLQGRDYVSPLNSTLPGRWIINTGTDQLDVLFSLLKTKNTVVLFQLFQVPLQLAICKFYFLLITRSTFLSMLCLSFSTFLKIMYVICTQEILAEVIKDEQRKHSYSYVFYRWDPLVQFYSLELRFPMCRSAITRVRKSVFK